MKPLTECNAQFLCAIPPNLYGPCEKYDLDTSLVQSALMRKAPTAKNEKQPSITVWGTGTPRKLMDGSRMLAPGWKPQTSLSDGLRKISTEVTARI